SRARLCVGIRAGQSARRASRTSQTAPGSPTGAVYAPGIERTLAQRPRTRCASVFIPTRSRGAGLPRALFVRRLRAQEVDKHVVKLFGVQVCLYLDRLEFNFGFFSVSPSESVAVPGAAI